MKKGMKKIIAREFLILLSVAILWSVIYFSVFQYDNYQIKQFNNFTSKIKTENSKKIFDEKQIIIKNENQEWFAIKLFEKFDIFNAKKTEIESLWLDYKNIVDSDSLKYLWNNKWDKKLINFYNESGFKSSIDLKLFIQKNLINSKDSMTINHIREHSKKINNLTAERGLIENKIYEKYEFINFNYYSILILLLIFFFIRYLFYAIKWSLKVLEDEKK